MSLGSQVKKYRLAAALTYGELEELSSVSIGSINAIEKRSSVRSAHASALARAFGLTLDQLLDEDADHSGLVQMHVANRRSSSNNEGTLVALERPAGYAVDTYWPFTIDKERVRAALHADDLARIDAYILGLVEAREACAEPAPPRAGNDRP